MCIWLFDWSEKSKQKFFKLAYLYGSSSKQKTTIFGYMYPHILKSLQFSLITMISLNFWIFFIRESMLKYFSTLANQQGARSQTFF